MRASRLTGFVVALLACSQGFAQDGAALQGLRRDRVLMSSTAQQRIFNPGNTRGMSSVALASLDRDLTRADRVYLVEPVSYTIMSDGKTNDWGISYFWEVVTAGQGTLVAIPVPDLASYTRGPKACECLSKYNGTCTTTGVCFTVLEPEKCTLKPMTVEDAVLKCINLRTAQGGTPAIDFAGTYLAKSGAQNVTVIVRGRLNPEPVSRGVWASLYVPGAGCFLEETGETTAQNKQRSASVVQRLLRAGVPTGRFEFGIKEKGIK